MLRRTAVIILVAVMTFIVNHTLAGAVESITARFPCEQRKDAGCEDVTGGVVAQAKTADTSRADITPRPAGGKSLSATNTGDQNRPANAQHPKAAETVEATNTNTSLHKATNPYKNCLVEHMTYLAPTVNLGNYDFAGNGKTTKDGHVVKYSCNGGTPGADGGASNNSYLYVPNGQAAPAAPPPLPPPPPPPPNPNDLALTASKTLTMPKPRIHWGPLPDQVVVNYPLWLWVDNPGAVGTSVSLRGVTVTMNATIDKITWHTGEPTDPANPSSPEAVIECQGRGEPAPSVEEVAQIPVADRHPPCGYTYHWKSTPQRTNRTGTWTMNAQVDWTLAWTSTINGAPGPNGSFALQSTNTAQIQVLELKSALIAHPTGTPRPDR